MIVYGLGKEVGDKRMKSDEDFKRHINGLVCGFFFF